MNIEKIDLATWERRDLFDLYMTRLKLVMNVTVDVDVTRLVRFCHKKGLKFYSVMMWLVGRRMNAHDEFRYHITEEGELLHFDYVSPSYTDFHPETGKFVKFVTEYSPDLREFCARVAADRELHKNDEGFLPQPINVFDISCLPWLHYNSLTLHVDEGRSTLYPVIIWGKHEKRGFRRILPVTLNMNHAVCDGFHLSRFFTELREDIDALTRGKI